jgi:4-aminobutyrate aminotransferase/(S)-3-amino-2-methylpropionate transaminase
VLRSRLDTLASKYPVIGEVRGRGLMQAVELVSDAGAKTPDPALTSALTAACHRNGLLTLTCGTFGNVLRFLPPLVISEELLDEGLSVFESALAEVAG